MSKAFSVVNYQPSLFNKINDFWEESGLGGSHRGDNLEVIDETLSAGGHLLVMVNENEEVIGTSWLTNDRRRTYIHHFGIKAGFRKQGLAKLLMDKTMEIARLDGYQVKLEVHKDNIAARSLYSQYGFKYLGDYEVLINREI